MQNDESLLDAAKHLTVGDLKAFLAQLDTALLQSLLGLGFVLLVFGLTAWALRHWPKDPGAPK